MLLSQPVTPRETRIVIILLSKHNFIMRLVGPIGLILALVMAVGAFIPLNDLQVSLVSLTTGPLQSMMNFIGVFWLLIVGLVGVVILAGVAKLAIGKF